jgi:hypothetical protein
MKLRTIGPSAGLTLRSLVGLSSLVGLTSLAACSVQSMHEESFDGTAQANLPSASALRHKASPLVANGQMVSLTASEGAFPLFGGGGAAPTTLASCVQLKICRRTSKKSAA